MKRKFKVTFELEDFEISEGVIELDQKVIDAVDEEWLKMFYKSLTTPEKIAAHIAFNMCVNDYIRLTQLDGWADLDDSYAKMIEWPQGLDDFSVTAKEITTRPEPLEHPATVIKE